MVVSAKTLGLKRSLSCPDYASIKSIKKPSKKGRTCSLTDLDLVNEQIDRLVESVSKVSIEARVECSREFRDRIITIDDMPDELLELIFSKLNIRDAINFGSSSKRLLSILPRALDRHMKRVCGSYIAAIPQKMRMEYPEISELFSRRSFGLVETPCESGLQKKRYFQEWLNRLFTTIHERPSSRHVIFLSIFLTRNVFIRDGIPPETFRMFLSTRNETVKEIVLKHLLTKCSEEHDFVFLKALKRIAGDFLTSSMEMSLKIELFNIYLELNKVEESVQVLEEIPKKQQNRDRLLYRLGGCCKELHQLDRLFWVISGLSNTALGNILFNELFFFCRKLLKTGQLEKVFSIVVRLPESFKKRSLVNDLIEAYIKREDVESTLNLINELSDQVKIENTLFELAFICIKKGELEKGVLLMKRFPKDANKNLLIYELSLAYLKKGNLEVVLELFPEFMEEYWGRDSILKRVSEKYLERGEIRNALKMVGQIRDQFQRQIIFSKMCRFKWTFS